MTDAYSAEPSALASAGGGSPASLNLHRYISAFRRRLLAFGCVVAIVFLVVAMVTVRMTPHYTATAQVMIDARKQTVVDVEQVMSGLPADASAVDTEVEVLKSRALAEKVVAQLRLDQEPEYAPKTKKAMSDAQRHQAVVDKVEKNLKIARAGLTYVIGINFSAESPALAAKVANAFAATYTEQQVQSKMGANEDATRFLTQRVEELRGQVEAAEAAVQHYKTANGLLSAQGNTLTENDISNLSQQVATARATQAEQEARLTTARRQLARGSNGDDVGEALSSPVVQQLRQQRAQVSRQVADMQQRYGPLYPDLLRSQKQLADIDQQIQAEIHRVISNLDAQAQVARQRTASLEGSLGSKQNTLAANNNASVQQNELERRAESLRTLYQAFLDRLQQTTAQQGLQDPDARLLSTARVPLHPSSPNLPLFLLAGLLAGLGLGAAMVILLELLENRLTTAEDVERLDVPALPSVPSLESTLPRGLGRKSSPIDYVVAHPLSAFAESFRTLRASIFTASSGGRAPIVLAVTSALPGEGKTVTAACLARSISMAGQSVVLVDCDLRRPSLSAIITREPVKSGLLELLETDLPLDQALMRDAKTGLSVIALRKAVQTPKDLFGDPKMDTLLAALRERFDVVILDTAPVLAVADSRVLAQKADAVLMIARWRRTSRHAVAAGLNALESVSAPIVGVSLTRVDMREQARSGYGDPGYFANAVRDYYVQ